MVKVGDKITISQTKDGRYVGTKSGAPKVGDKISSNQYGWKSGMPRVGNVLLMNQDSLGRNLSRKSGDDLISFITTGTKEWNLYWNDNECILDNNILTCDTKSFENGDIISSGHIFAHSTCDGTLIIFDINDLQPDGTPTIYRGTLPVPGNTSYFAHSFPHNHINGKYMNITGNIIEGYFPNYANAVYYYRVDLTTYGYVQYTYNIGLVLLRPSFCSLRVSDSESVTIGFSPEVYIWYNNSDPKLPPGSDKNAWNSGAFFIKFNETTNTPDIVRIEKWIDWDPNTGDTWYVPYTYPWVSNGDIIYNEKIYSIRAGYHNEQDRVYSTDLNGSGISVQLLNDKYENTPRIINSSDMWVVSNRVSPTYEDDLIINDTAYKFYTVQSGGIGYTDYQQMSDNYTIYNTDIYYIIPKSTSLTSYNIIQLEIWKKSISDSNFSLLKTLLFDDFKQKYNLSNPQFLSSPGILIKQDTMYVICGYIDGYNSGIVFYMIPL